MRSVIIVCDACGNKWIPDMNRGEMVTPVVSIGEPSVDPEITSLENKLLVLKMKEPIIRPDGGAVQLGNKSFDLCGSCFNKIKTVLKLPVVQVQAQLLQK